MAASPVVSPAWVAGQLGSLVLLDASWYMPGSGRDAVAEFERQRLPGARFLDLDAVKDGSSPMPHMLPTPAAFAAACDALGVHGDSHVVIYDGSGCFSSPRAWWMFRALGHDRVSVMEGGLPLWCAQARELEAGAPAVPASAGGAAAASASPASFPAVLQPSRVVSLDTVLSRCVQSREWQLVDARPAGRFAGTAPEPRAGLRSGHAPHARSLPFAQLLASDGTFLPAPQLRSAFEAAGVGLQSGQPVVASCGTGVTACIVVLAAAILGRDNLAVYDGSWTEYGGRNDTPVVTGEPEAPEASSA